MSQNTVSYAAGVSISYVSHLCRKILNSFFCDGSDLPFQMYQQDCKYAPGNLQLKKCPYREGPECTNPKARREAEMLQNGGY